MPIKRQQLLEEGARRRRAAIVLPLLLIACPGGHLSISALLRQLRMCGVVLSERYLAQVLTGKFGATRGRRVHDGRKAVIWRGVTLRAGGLEKAREELAAEYESVLEEAGLGPVPMGSPSWRSYDHETLNDLASGRGDRVLVRLPADENDHQAQTVEARTRNYLADAMAAGPYNHAMEEMYWRETVWGLFPEWHQRLIAAHVEDGTTVAEFARNNPGVHYEEVKRALQLHRARAGLRPGD